MKKAILIFGLLIFSISIQAQFLFEKMDLTKVRIFEDSLKSECNGLLKMNVGAGFFKGAKEKVDYYPLTFSRSNETFFPNCKVEYYYSEKDSVIHTIVSDWDIMRYVTNLNKDQKLIDDQVGRKDDYFNKYEQIKNKVIKLIGSPSKQTDIYTTSTGYYGETIWKTTKQITTLSISFTSTLQVIGNKWRVGTFRIRLMTELKKK